MDDIVVFGTGEFAEIVHGFFSKDDRFNVAGFTVHDGFMGAKEFCGLPVVPFDDVHARFPPESHKMFVAMGYTDNNKKREAVFRQVKEAGYGCASYVDPTCSVGDGFECGENCFVFGGNVIQEHVTLGDNVIIWSNNVISHHVAIRDHCFVISGCIIGGHVTIENNCFLGLGCIIRNGISVGPECVIGAGAVILDSTGSNEVYVSRGTEKLGISSNDLKKL